MQFIVHWVSFFLNLGSSLILSTLSAKSPKRSPYLWGAHKIRPFVALEVNIFSQISMNWCYRLPILALQLTKQKRWAKFGVYRILEATTSKKSEKTNAHISIAEKKNWLCTLNTFQCRPDTPRSSFHQARHKNPTIPSTNFSLEVYLLTSAYSRDAGSYSITTS